MHNKKGVIFFSYLFLLASAAAVYFLKENTFFHMGYHAAVISVVMLSLYLSMKDIVLVIMFFSAAIWGMGFFEILKMTNQLIAETSIILLIAVSMGWYEIVHRAEKSKQDTIVSYKKEQVEALKTEIAGLNSENSGVSEEIKKHRRKFVS